ncbi:MAG: hypothetical protein DRI34_14155 [Deltaproteobacteria bacterium]|nr:MAG: hypothetical protein DRI34_14155 [Deltaproteobacteria bacterium]
MDSGYQVDIEREAILFDGEWLTTQQLANKIKSMIDSQDFRVGAVGAALEHLQNSLKDVKSYTCKLLAEDAARLERHAGQAGKSAEAYIRQAVQAYLAAQPPLQDEATGQDTGGTVPAQLTTITTEPASAEEAQQAVELTAKKNESLPKVLVDPALSQKKAEDTGQELEGGWFKKKD